MTRSFEATQKELLRRNVFDKFSHIAHQTAGEISVAFLISETALTAYLKPGLMLSVAITTLTGWMASQCLLPRHLYFREYNSGIDKFINRNWRAIINNWPEFGFYLNQCQGAEEARKAGAESVPSPSMPSIDRAPPHLKKEFMRQAKLTGLRKAIPFYVCRHADCFNFGPRF